MGIRVFVRRTISIACLCALIGVSFCALAAQTNAPAPASPALQAALAEAEKGAAAAQFRLGMMFLNGKEVPRDLEMAAHWLQKAAEQNHAAAQFNLAVLYSQGAGVPQNYPEAAKWFQRAADQNDPASQYNLGILYANGAGVAKNMTNATALFRKAGEKGDARAQMALAYALANGTGIPPISRRPISGSRRPWRKATAPPKTNATTSSPK